MQKLSPSPHSAAIQPALPPNQSPSTVQTILAARLPQLPLSPAPVASTGKNVLANATALKPQAEQSTSDSSHSGLGALAKAVAKAQNAAQPVMALQPGQSSSSSSSDSFVATLSIVGPEYLLQTVLPKLEQQHEELKKYVTALREQRIRIVQTEGKAQRQIQEVAANIAHVKRTLSAVFPERSSSKRPREEPSPEEGAEPEPKKSGRAIFREAQIPIGAVLQSSKGKKTCKVVDDDLVEFQGEKMSLTAAAQRLLGEGRSKNITGTKYWYYEGETVFKRIQHFKAAIPSKSAK